MRYTRKTGQRIVSRRGFVAGGIGVAAAGVAAIPAHCTGKIYPGVHVSGIDVSGMAPDDGVAALRAGLADFETAAVTFALDDRTWTASLAELGMEIDYRSVVENAMASVRGSGVAARYRSLLDDNARYDVPLYVRERPGVFDGLLRRIADDVYVEPRDARLYRSGRSIKTMEERAGVSLDVEQARADAIAVVRAGRHGIVHLRTDPVQPEVVSGDLDGFRDEAQRLIGEAVVFTMDDREYIFDEEMLAGALMIGPDSVPGLDMDHLEERIAAIEADVAVQPTNVKLGWEGGLYVVEHDTAGRRLDRETFIARIREAASSTTRVAALPMEDVQAPARVDNLESLGLDGLLATGASSFAGSSYERATNVAVSARNVSYKLVAPGDEFSYNDMQGPITEEHGYIAGSIIMGDFAATDIGGGVCQVSTTVFRAAQNAGFRFSEWNPHSWRLAFYEADGSSPGLDAAIYQPNSEWEAELDLRFTNSLDSWLLLQVVVEGEWVSAQFYGKHPGWNVEVFPARVSEPKPVPQLVERVNPALAPGERRMVQQAQPGYTVAVRRTVTGADGTVLSDGDFVSDYLSQPEAWEVGPS